MNFTKTLVGIALAGVFFISPSNNAQATPVTWDLVDHGFGSLGPFYGLRLDNPSNSGDPRLFSFGGASTAALVFDSAGTPTASISGTIIENGNADNPACSGGAVDSPGDCNVWNLEYTFTGIAVEDALDPLAGFTATGGSGSVVLQDLSISLTLGSKQNGANLAFLWLPDGHRLPNDDTTLVGRGWVDPTDNLPGANDFLFTGVQLVPEPGAVALFGMGLIGLGFMRRRRKHLV